MDGYVTIGTKLDTQDFDIKYEKLARDVEKKEINIEIKTQQAEQTRQQLEAVSREIEQVENEMGEISAKAERFAFLNQKSLNDLTQKEGIEWFELSTEGVEQQEKKLVDRIAELNIQQSKLNTKLKEQNEAIGEANFKYREATQKFNEYKDQVNSTNFSNVKESLNNIGNSMSNIIQKVGKWVLAVFSIRSAYMFVRQSVSTLSQYNDQIASDIEYIRFALATALQPVIETIIQLAYKLLSLIGYIANAWFGVNIFAKASAKNFEKAKNSLKAGSKAAKELKKQLAGFDEMNILQDNNASGGGGGNGFTAPSFDLGEIKEPDLTVIYSWTDKVKDIFNNLFEKIKKNVKKVMKELGFSPEYIKAWELFADGVKDVINGLLDFIGGLIEFIVGLVTGDTEKVLEGIKKMAIGIWEVIKGLAKNIIGVFGMILVGLYDTLIKPIIGVINDINNTISRIITDLINFIINAFAKAGNGIKNTFNNIVGFINGIINTINGKFAEMGSKIGGAVGGAFKTVINGVLAWIELQLNKPIDTINNLISVISKVGINVSRLSRIRLPRLAKGGIINQPGRGVPVGNALAGERGQEGVIPLTDSQQMALLGEAIGKYITINANITNTMNGRVISRELQKINNESDFAFNR